MTSLSSIALLLLSPALTTALLASPQSPKPKYIKLEEEALRKRATKTLMPRFPQDAKKHGASGLAVAEVEIDEKGRVAYIKVTAAPNELIRAAVADAVNQWRFKPITIEGAAVHMLGKLTFHYVIDRDGARVENPKHSADNKQ